MDKANIRVLIKEPRGFIRILQVLFSVLAWSTTAGFSTISKLDIYCPDDSQAYAVEYKIHYPFDLREIQVSAPTTCKDDSEVVGDTLPIDFSSTAMLYVLVCALSLIYALGAAAYYCLLTAKYETDPLAPMLDLGLTIFFTAVWLVITCAWALNVSDLKHYTHPNYFKEYTTICSQDEQVNCQASHPGKWSSLMVSIVCGFTCVVLWFGSAWFIFKETTLHRQQGQQTTTTTTAAAPQPSSSQQQQQY